MGEDSSKVLSNVIRIDDERIQDHLKHIVRDSVEETLNALLEAEAARLVGASRYERTLHTTAGEVRLKVPKLRKRASPAAAQPSRQRLSSATGGVRARLRRP